MTSVVIDASVVASWFLLDEAGGEHAKVLDQLDRISIHVPSIFEHEFMNILLMAGKKGRIDRSTQEDILEIVSRYPLLIEPSSVVFTKKTGVLEMARAHNLTAYDAAYLELAVRLGSVPLITYDKELLMAAKKLKLKTKL